MKNKWLHFCIDKENIFGLVCGLIMILLSIAMALFNSEVVNIIFSYTYLLYFNHKKEKLIGFGNT